MRALAAGVLLVAAALKFYPHYVLPPITGRLTALLPILAECVFGAWLLSGLLPGIAWWSAVLLFSLFGGYNLLQIASGAESCGCFGAIEVSPWLTFIIDAIVVAALLTFPSAVVHSAARARTFGYLVASASLIGSVAISLVILFAPSPLPLRSFQDVTGQHSSYFLDPDSWRGRKLPILEQIDIGATLARGRWQLMLYRHSCATCRAEVAALLARKDAKGPVKRWALIEIAPYTDQTRYDRFPGVLHGRLSDSLSWYVDIPSTFQLQDGIVVTSSTGEPHD